MKRKRLHYIDQAKAIGILLIVLGHVSYMTGPCKNTGSYFKISIFYMTSGLLTFLHDSDGQSRSAGKDILHKMKTLLIPYFFYSLLALLWQYHVSSMNGNGYTDLYGQILETVTFRGVSTLWFLPTLFFAFVLHDCFRALLKNRNRILRVIVCAVVLCFIPFWIIHVSHNPVYDTPVIDVKYFLSLTIYRSLAAFWFFEISYLFLDRLTDLPGWFHGIVLAGSLLFVNVIGYSQIDFNMFRFGERPLLFFLMGLVFSCSIIGLLRKADLSLKPLSYIGKASLFIMATHAPLPILTDCENLVMKWIPQQSVINGKYIIYVAVTFVMVMTVELILYRIWKIIKKAVRNISFLSFLKYC